VEVRFLSGQVVERLKLEVEVEDSIGPRLKASLAPHMLFQPKLNEKIPLPSLNAKFFPGLSLELLESPRFFKLKKGKLIVTELPPTNIYLLQFTFKPESSFSSSYHITDSLLQFQQKFQGEFFYFELIVSQDKKFSLKPKDVSALNEITLEFSDVPKIQSLNYCDLF